MNNQFIYKQLGSPDDKFAMDIANNDTVSPSLRVIAFCILHDYIHAKALYDTHTASTGELDEGIFWLEAQIMINYRDEKEANALRDVAVSVVSRAQWSIFSRVFLGTIVESEKEFSRAIELYRVVLALCPSNLAALGGLVRSYIQLGANDEARSILKAIKIRKPFDKLEKSRKVYWQATFLNYVLIVRRLEIAITVGLCIFILAFLLPTMWIVPVLTTGLCLLFAYLFQMKYGINVPALKQLAVSIVIIWLIGYVARNFFNFLENIH